MTFDPESCIRDDEARFAADPTTGHVEATECTCTYWCGDPGEAGCCWCNHTDVYEPCPAVGHGCGIGALPGSSQTCDTDCCTPEQWAAATSRAAAAAR